MFNFSTCSVCHTQWNLLVHVPFSVHAEVVSINKRAGGSYLPQPSYGYKGCGCQPGKKGPPGPPGIGKAGPPGPPGACV